MMSRLMLNLQQSVSPSENTRPGASTTAYPSTVRFGNRTAILSTLDEDESTAAGSNSVSRTSHAEIELVQIKKGPTHESSDV